jgi:hypothetical protein
VKSRARLDYAFPGQCKPIQRGMERIGPQVVDQDLQTLRKILAPGVPLNRGSSNRLLGS